MEMPFRAGFPLAASMILTGSVVLLCILTGIFAQATALDYRQLLRFVLLYGCLPQLVIFAILAANCTRKFAATVAVFVIATWIPVAQLAVRVFLV
ncbi:hypothetical protein [Massilia aquatica]|uniref:Uncharacterized protein n=1 Tax=Massilia aquatica TaxID=2609000 RepID=A0ABX0MIG7_9BURK|nr:hypothetical protein [Massilia aquatica]NHZ41961.1 hypothetical protein [Massilia aquatica]